jgi:predicted small metal-binding protein
VISVLHCDCGFKARGQSEDELVAAVQLHAREAHGMALSRDDVLLLVFRAELNEQAPLTVPRDMTRPIDEKEEPRHTRSRPINNDEGRGTT